VLQTAGEGGVHFAEQEDVHVLPPLPQVRSDHECLRSNLGVEAMLAEAT
jgi:hypothetical protein